MRPLGGSARGTWTRLRLISAIVGCTLLVLASVAYPETAWAWSQPSSFQLPSDFFSSADNGQLTGVSCTSRHACTAVGSSDAEGGAFFERWNGVDWSVQAAAPTVGVSVPYIGLGSISCISNRYCVAVGTADDSNQHSLVESWNGSAWSVQPSGSGLVGGELGTVSCSSAVACMAAGDNNFDGSPLVLRWNGRAWSGQAVNVEAVALSCFSRSMCAFIGQPLSNIGTVGTSPGCRILGFWTPGRWAKNLVLPCANPTPLAAVSCTSASACTAVGSAAYRWNGQHWTVEPNAQRRGDFLDGVSCVSRTACVGVGRRRVSDTTQALVKRWNGSRWSTVYVSNLAGSELDSVSCTSATTCVAVGYYTYYLGDGVYTAPLLVSNG